MCIPKERPDETHPHDLHLQLFHPVAGAGSPLRPGLAQRLSGSPHVSGNASDAQIAGDIAMRESEVNAVLKALRSQGLNIVAIHNHMLDTRPNVIFLHYWGRGPAPKLAAGFRSALDALGK
jgi:hypothetical protein